MIAFVFRNAIPDVMYALCVYGAELSIVAWTVRERSTSRVWERESLNGAVRENANFGQEYG